MVGFDNWEVMTSGARPPLTSVDMNLDALGTEAGDSLLRDDGRPQALRRQAAALLAGRAGILRRRDRRRKRRTTMSRSSYAPIPFADVTIAGPFWRERLETVLTRTIPSQHAKLSEAGILESLKLPKPVPAAQDPAQQPQLHHAGVLGLGCRQVDRGGELRARPPARPRHRGEDRRHRRRPRKGAVARRLSQLLVQRARASRTAGPTCATITSSTTPATCSKARSPISARPASASSST